MNTDDWNKFKGFPTGSGFVPLNEAIDINNMINNIPTTGQFKRKAAMNYGKMKVSNFGKALTLQKRTPVTKGRVVAKTVGDYANKMFGG